MSQCKNFVKESLRQNRFWLRIMQEHALFIRLGLPCDANDLIDRAKKLEELFAKLRMRANETPKNKEAVRKLNRDVIEALEKIIDYKSDVLGLLVNCNIGGSNYPLLVDHIRREAIRFRTILLRLQNGIELPLAEKVLQEEIFWLRIMGDHARFIAHLLDPSERNLVEQSFNFAERFETLRLQARDLESMVVPRTFENYLLPEKDIVKMPIPPEFGDGLPNAFLIPRLERFNEEVIMATEDIFEFKETAKQLIEACKVLSIINPLLADHVLREAGMALEDLGIIEQKLPIDC
ncbi:MAG: DUF2935 domain-containing protein [Firmicutes bacterium]|nr:DUF2935 domain-containing protein [Bacillota bacterium]